MSLAEVATLPEIERATRMVTRTVPRRPTRAAKAGGSLVRMIATVGGTFGAGLAVAVVAVAMNGQPQGEAVPEPAADAPVLGVPLGDLAAAPATNYFDSRSDLAVDDGHDLYAQLISFRDQAAATGAPQGEALDGLFAPDVPVPAVAAPQRETPAPPVAQPEPRPDPRTMRDAVLDLLRSPEVRALELAMQLDGPPPLAPVAGDELLADAMPMLREAALLMSAVEDAALAARICLLRGDSAGALRVAPPGVLRARAMLDQGLGAEALVEAAALPDHAAWQTRLALIEAFTALESAPARRQFEIWAGIAELLDQDAQAPRRAALSLARVRNIPLKWRIAARLRELTGLDCGIDAEAWLAALHVSQ